MPRRAGLKSHYLLLLLAGYFTCVLNWPFFSRVYGYIFSLENYNLWFALTVPVFLFCILYILFSLLVIKGVTKLLFIPLLIVSAGASYASYEYGIVFNYGMIENIVETDASEAASYFNLASISFVLVLGMIPAGLLWRLSIEYRSFWGELGFRFAGIAASVLMILGIAWGFYEDYAAVGRNNQGVQRYIVPTEYLYSSTNYLNRNVLSEPLKYLSLGNDAKIVKPDNQAKARFLVIVVGETARAANYEYNGYPRATNSFTKPLNMVSLGSVESCGTATAVSVPCMFSFLKHENFEKRVAANQDNLLDVLTKAGVDVTWIDNDSGCKGVCDRVSSINMDLSASHDGCDGEYCYDEVMLPYLDQLLADENIHERVIVMHVIGSHGPTYYRRYPEAHRYFVPDCQRSDIQNCTAEELRNTYDNTIRYTDYMVAQMVERLSHAQDRYDTALIYMSDHGESLGESGLYLHGMPYSVAPAEQTHVPALVWVSEPFKTDKRWQSHCMRKPEGRVSQDMLSHSVLGLMSVETRLYDASLDFASNWNCGHRLANQTEAADGAGS